MDLEKEKAAARHTAYARRKDAFALNQPGKAGHLSSFLAGHRGVALSGYMPIRTEISPVPAMEEAAAHGQVSVPVITEAGKPLKFALWEPGCVMQDGPFGAQIPADLTYIEPEIVIVPLVAFTAQGGRLGYGGGFYDRTLEKLRAKGPTLAIGFAFAAQQADSLPLEPTDQPLDMIITEQGILTP